jgi:hypothetical protein
MLLKRSSRNVAKQATAQSLVLPAPRGGMDDRAGIASEDMNSCLWAINMMPVEYGMRVRQGYREWQIGLPSQVRTIVPYEGLVETDIDDKIFAICAEGIYDVSAQGGVPVQKLAFTDTGDDAGWGVYTHYTKPNGDDLIYYADNANGLFIYDPAGDTWAQATGLTPNPETGITFNVEDIVYIVSHKLRLWFVTKDSTIGWYLPIRSYTGEATPFFFGSKFKHGGDLVGLYNWTTDGGDGRDDILVAVSRGGDVMPYTGDDPSSDMTWENVGVFFIGLMPRGHRVASEYGGDLLLLSTNGIVAMSELVAGLEPEDPNKSQMAAKISRLVRLDMRNYANDHGWNIKFVADESILVVNTPLRTADDTYRQYVMGTTMNAWGLWRDVPYICGEPFNGDLLIGDPDGRVLRMDTEVDNVDINGEGGDDIKWYVLSSFTSAGAPGLQKRVQFIRPHFSATDSRPSFDVYARYDYFAIEPLAPTKAPQTYGNSIWDTALWDSSIWASPQQLGYQGVRGATGMGTVFAIAMTGRSRGNTLFGSWDVTWDTGGFL